MKMPSGTPVLSYSSLFWASKRGSEVRSVYRIELWARKKIEISAFAAFSSLIGVHSPGARNGLASC